VLGLTEVKIGIIGAGSAVFSMSLVRDLCLMEGLKGSTVCFMDIDKGRLRLVYGLAERYADETNSDVKFEQTLERREAMQDVDFMINTALVGGHESRLVEQRVGEEHGYHLGLSLGRFHQFNLMLDVARDMEEICPDAWLIQAGNPVFDGCTLMTRETKTKVIGLCHGHYGAYQIAKVLGLDPKEVSFQAPGVNHCIWLTHFRHKGKDAYPLIDEWIENKSEEYWRSWDGSPLEGQMSPAAVSLYRIFGLFPVGDTVQQTPSIAWWHYVDLETMKRWFNKYGGFISKPGWSYYLASLEKKLDRMRQLYEDSSTSVSQEFPPTMSGEQHVPIIGALVNDNEGKFQVNVPNRGALEGFRDDVVVEVPAMVSGRGVQPLHGALPRHLTLHILRTRILAMELGLEAFLTGSRNVLLNTILSDHRTRSHEQAQTVMQDLLALPFNRALRDHFK
jgi:alpha-galactosidase